MFSFIKGMVVEAFENQLVVENNGIGYQLNVSLHTVTDKGRIGDPIKLLTHMAVKEDGISLYGFYCKEEKAMFLRLIDISGIGPKAALSILSGTTIDELAAMIINGDAARLTKIKGIGKKTAERIVLELKDKIKGEYDNIEIGDTTSALPINQDAVLALMSMGFSKQEATVAVGMVNKENLQTEEIIIAALKKV